MKRRGSLTPRLLLDQSISLRTLEFLKGQDFDSKRVGEQGYEIHDDLEIARMAIKEGRLVITFDKDFGAIYYHYLKANSH